MVRAEDLLANGETACVARLGLAIAVLGFEPRRQVEERDGDQQVVGAEGLFANGKTASEERLGITKATLSHVQRG